MKFKFKKVLFSIFIMFLSTLVVYADAPESITINGGNLHYIDASQMLPNVDTTDGANDGQNLSIKLTTNEDVTYCVNPDKLLYTGTLTYSKGNKLGNEIAYIMENDSYLDGGGSDKDYFITNLAIWYLLAPNSNKLANYDFPNGKYKNTASDTVRQAYSLASAARNYNPTPDTVTVPNSNITMTLSNDGNYYVTSSINPTINGAATTYKVSLNNAPSGTKITDVSGTEKTSFNKGNAFIIKVPKGSVTAATSFTVTVSADFTNREAYVYNPTGGHDTQAVVLLTSNTSPKSTNITLRINAEITTSIQVSKIVYGTGTALSGAKFDLVKGTDVIDTWTSGSTPHPISNLSDGNYVINETTVPNGYINKNTVVTFTINNGRITNLSNNAILSGTTIIIYNEPEPVVGQAIISKRDVTTGEELPGAKLELYNSRGTMIREWISKTTPEIISNLDPGTYTLKETIAPNGYELSTETVSFIIGEDGKVVGGVVVMRNTPKPVVGQAIISKRDANTGKELPGAVLVVKDSTGKVIKRWTSTSKPEPIENLSPGTYTLSEVSAPKKYILNKQDITFTVKEDGTVSGTIIMKNYPDEVKENEQTGGVLSIVLVILGFTSLGYATYLLLKNKESNEM